MPAYDVIVAADPIGQVLRRDSISTPTIGAADRRLIGAGNLPVVAARANEFVTENSDELTGRKVPLKHARIALKYLESGAKMAFPLHRSISMAERAMPHKIGRQILQRIGKRVTMGARFSETLSLYPGFLDESTAGIIAAAEGTAGKGGSGNIQEAFRQAGMLMDTRIAFQTAVRRAMVYPIILVFAALGLIYVMCTRVIPEFAKIFLELGAELPWETKLVMDLSNFVVNYPYLVLLGLGAAFAGCLYVPRLIREIGWFSPQLALRVHGFLLKFKAIGKLNKLNLEISFTRVIMAVQKSGTPILDALALVQSLSWNLCYRSAIARLRRALEKGQSIGAAIEREETVFLPEFRAAVQFGSEINRIEEPLSNRLEMAEEEFKTLTGTIQELILPVLLTILGGAIFILAAACMRPVFSLGEVFSK